jgi:hypothetical protein
LGGEGITLDQDLENREILNTIVWAGSCVLQIPPILNGWILIPGAGSTDGMEPVRSSQLIREKYDDHDNFDSKYQPRFNSLNMGSQKDIVADWRKAAQKHWLPFGLFEHFAGNPLRITLMVFISKKLYTQE